MGGASLGTKGRWIVKSYRPRTSIPYYTCTHCDRNTMNHEVKRETLCSSVFMRELCETRISHCEEVASCDHMFCYATFAHLLKCGKSKKSCNLQDGEHFDRGDVPPRGRRARPHHRRVGRQRRLQRGPHLHRTCQVSLND